jgi:hypothetical protein
MVLLAKMVSGGLDPTQKLIVYSKERTYTQNALGLVGWAMWNVWRVRGPPQKFIEW